MSFVRCTLATHRTTETQEIGREIRFRCVSAETTRVQTVIQPLERFPDHYTVKVVLQFVSTDVQLPFGFYTGKIAIL